MSHYKILLVEDEPSWRNILGRHLSTSLNEMKATGDIQEAIDLGHAWDMLTQENDWSLLCTDIGLSQFGHDTEGVHLVSLAADKKIPTVIVSGAPALTPQHVRDFLKKYKVEDFIYKQSFDSAEFIALTRKILEKPFLPCLPTAKENNKLYIYSVNTEIAGYLKTNLEAADVKIVEEQDQADFFIIELQSSTTPPKMNNTESVYSKNILYYCEEHEKYLLQIDTEKALVIEYSNSNLGEFLGIINSWVQRQK